MVKSRQHWLFSCPLRPSIDFAILRVKTKLGSYKPTHPHGATGMVPFIQGLPPLGPMTISGLFKISHLWVRATEMSACAVRMLEIHCPPALPLEGFGRSPQSGAHGGPAAH